MGKLDGEVALVTGASRGIGKACALALAKEGCEVFVNYVRSQEKAEAVCELIRKEGGTATPVGFDVAKPDEIKDAIKKIEKEGKKITVLVNNSGITRDGLYLRAKIEDWDEVMDTNLRSAFLTSQAVLRGMMKAKKGSIINMSSIVGVTGNPGQASYCASKAGVIGLTKSLAKEVGSRNIRVNAVAPGFISTDMTDALNDDQKESLDKLIPLGRQGLPEEIAHTVVFLASSDSNYITGQTLMVDGGMGM